MLGERPDIPCLYDVRLDEAPYYLEMEYSPAGDLADWSEMKGGIDKIPLEQRLSLIVQVA